MASKLSPFVYWGQSTDTVSLKVDLRSCEDVEVSLTEESVDFQARGLGVKGINQYAFHLDFYLPVDPEKSRYRKTDIAVEFQIQKAVADSWPRLTEQRQKLPWLKIDFDKFPLDDSDLSGSEADNLSGSQSELIDKLSKDMGENDSIEPVSIKQGYLFFYNLFQFVGYTFIFIKLLYSVIMYGESGKQSAFESTGTQMMVCQTVACLEIIHPIIGLVKSSVMMSFSQVVGRNLILFLLVLQEPRLQIAPICWYLFIVWSAVEIVRYPFYMLQIIDIHLNFLYWLRYTIWIPLYPLGIIAEATILFKSISYFEETGFFSVALPNSANFAFYFPYFLMVHLVLLGLGGTNNMKYMASQRRKQLSTLRTSSSSKSKSS